MRITIYELLGMIKDGKAPKTIKSEGHYYYYNELEKDYYEGMGYAYEYLLANTSVEDLDNEIEIIEYTPKEKKKKTLEEEFEEYNKNKKIDKISLHFDEDLSEFLATTNINSSYREEICQGGFENLLIDKINEIIDYLDYLKSKGEE